MTRPIRVAAALVVASAALAVATAPALADVPKLPKRFIWGVSNSAFRSDDHTTDNNWNYYIARDNGPNPVGTSKEAYRNSVDFYGRYASDIGLAKGLGVNAYRISINWARVEPRAGRFSE
jgi:beta-glucosidase